jgi:hypothetical protein
LADEQAELKKKFASHISVIEKEDSRNYQIAHACLGTKLFVLSLLVLPILFLFYFIFPSIFLHFVICFLIFIRQTQASDLI